MVTGSLSFATVTPPNVRSLLLYAVKRMKARKSPVNMPITFTLPFFITKGYEKTPSGKP
jgi:hypothetical protein